MENETMLTAFTKSKEDFIKRNGEGKLKNPKEIRFGRFDRHMIERCNLERYVGKEGVTQIIVEYDNDLGEGWMRSINGFQ